MNDSNKNVQRRQSVNTEQFLYLFLRMRKSEVRRIVGILQTRYPDEEPTQLARRLVSSCTSLSALGGSLLTLPLLMPGIGQALKLLGVVGTTSMFTRMHIYMIMQIALLFGKDIDDTARVREIAMVVAACGLVGASPILARNYGIEPRHSLLVGTLAATATTQIIGRTAIALYSRGVAAEDELEKAIAQGATTAA